MVPTENFEQVEVCSADALWAWLAAHHAQEDAVWLVTYKKSVPDRYVAMTDVLDALIAYGWIDGVRRKTTPFKLADGTALERTMQLISPRRAQHWSKSYKERAAKLITAGKMRAAGQAAIDRSKANGLWTFMDDVDALLTPADLQIALEAKACAAAFFDALAPSAKRFTLRWIKLAKTDKTRAKRIATTVEKSAAGEFVPGVKMS